MCLTISGVNMIVIELWKEHGDVEVEYNEISIIINS